MHPQKVPLIDPAASPLIIRGNVKPKEDKNFTELNALIDKKTSFCCGCGIWVSLRHPKDQVAAIHQFIEKRDAIKDERRASAGEDGTLPDTQKTDRLVDLILQTKREQTGITLLATILSSITESEIYKTCLSAKQSRTAPHAARQSSLFNPFGDQ